MKQTIDLVRCDLCMKDLSIYTGHYENNVRVSNFREPFDTIYIDHTCEKCQQKMYDMVKILKGDLKNEIDANLIVDPDYCKIITYLKKVWNMDNKEES